jgi:hypothetical protein
LKIPVPQWPYLKRPQNKREHLAIKEAPHQFSEDAKQQQEGAGFLPPMKLLSSGAIRSRRLGKTLKNATAILSSWEPWQMSCWAAPRGG